MSSKLLLALTLFLTLILSACQIPAPALPAATPEPAASDALPLEVETAEVVVGVGSPIPVDIVITGRLPDTCTQIGSMEQTVDDFAIRVALKAIKPALNDCIADSIPFRTAMHLNTISLPAGVYTITVNDTVSTTLTMPIEPPAVSADLRPIPVSHVNIDVGIGSPIPVDAFVSGEWPDLCAQLAEIEQRIEGNSIDITLLASAADPACPPDYLGLPFRIAVPINVVELPEGSYTVTVNGVSAAFDLPVTPPVSTPTGDGLSHYQGPGPYASSPTFEIAYDPTVWDYVEDDGSGRQSQLLHQALPGCSLWLRAGPAGATAVANASLAGYEWTIGQVQPAILLYSVQQDDVAFIFGLMLPEAYSAGAMSQCQEAAEAVISSFAPVSQ